MGLPERPDVQKIAEYRRKAIDAVARAVTAKDEVTRSAWQKISLSYEDMADRLERKRTGPNFTR